jgi:hypothetical protein
MSRRWMTVVGVWSISALPSASGCGAKAADIEIVGPSLRADPVPRPLSYESRLSDGPLSTLSSTEVRAAAKFLIAHPYPPVGCSESAKAVDACASGSACSEESAAFDECLALASLSQRGEDTLVRVAIGWGPILPRECAQLAKASRGATPGAETIFDGLPEASKNACNQIIVTAAALSECNHDQVAGLNRCLTELIYMNGRDMVVDRLSTLVEVAARGRNELEAAFIQAGAVARVLVSPGSRASEPAISFPSSPAAAVALPSTLESQIINGLADFLVERAREEGLDYLAESVGERLCERSAKVVQVRTFFPETCRLLRGRDGLANVGLAQFGSTLQKALERDLRGLLPVMLNHAISKLDGKWGHLDVFLQAVVTTATGGSPPRLDELLRIGEQRIECDGENDLACALRLICITAVAVHESRAEDACMDGTWGATCAAAAAAKVTDALARDAKLEAWLDYGIRADSEQGQRLVRQLIDQLVELAQLGKSGEPSIAQLVALLRTGVEVVIPSGNHERIYLLLGQLENGVNRWGELGYVVYHVGDAILNGRAPARALIAAAETVSCTSITDDLGCGIRASGYIASALLSLQAQWPKPGSAPPQVAAFLRAAEKRLALGLGHPDNMTLRAWLRTRFVIGPAPGKLPDKVRLIDLIQQLLGELRGLEVAIEKAGKPGADRLVAAADVLNASARLFHGVVSMTIQSEASRARALRVIDGIVEASAAVSRRELAPFMTALYALAVDLGVPDPVPERVRKYVPFVTALTTAENAEQVSAAFQRYAAPAGGYRVKQEDGSHYSVSALVGAAGGVERGISSDIDFAGQFSIFAPVGIDATFGTKKLPGWGFMLSVFDLGALTAARIDNSNDQEMDADVSFKQVFSPGLHVRVPVLGPTVLGAGLSMVPGLRRPNETGQAEAIFRGLLFVAIDVTLFEL